MSAGVSVTTLLAFIAIFSAINSTSQLVLTNEHTGKTLFSHRIEENEVFAITFIHSVNLSPVTDYFQIQKGQIVLIATEFYDFGAGMQSELEPGQTFTNLPSGGMRIEGMKILDSFAVLISYVFEQTLKIADLEIPLQTLDLPGQPVRFVIN